jgi:hypothetical protein
VGAPLHTQESDVLDVLPPLSFVTSNVTITQMYPKRVR